MSFRYTPDNVCPVPLTLGASLTASPVSQEFRISHSGSLNILVGIQCSGVTAGAGISAKLQSSILGGVSADWQDGNSVAITGNGWVYIRMNVQTSTDQAKLPLADVGRLVVTTGVNSAVTISQVCIVQGQ